MKVCPEHKERLIMSPTRFGARYSCPVPQCDVVGWGGNTSTPANQETRDARKRAHLEFDPHWKGLQGRRTRAYAALSKILGLPKTECHIGMMSKVDCDRTIMACQYGLVIDGIVASEWNVCQLCGRRFKGEKGLKDHQRSKSSKCAKRSEPEFRPLTERKMK